MSPKLQDVLEALVDGVIVLDRTGRVREVNNEAARILEISAEALSGAPLEDLLEQCVRVGPVC